MLPTDVITTAAIYHLIMCTKVLSPVGISDQAFTVLDLPISTYAWLWPDFYYSGQCCQ